MSQEIFIGASRSAEFSKTIQIIVRKLKALSPLEGRRLLDVGCGNGAFTIVLGERYDEVCGIDVQDHYLEKFRHDTAEESKFMIANMSASDMTFPDAHFDTVMTIETLEHIPDLNGACREIHRVLRQDGELILTVPNRWFPCENHGMKFGGFENERAPFLTYFPWLHRRIARARVFTVRDLDKLFLPLGMKRAALDYAWPTFEHPGNRLQPLFKPAFGLMRKLEQAPLPLRMFGTSIVAKYIKT